MNCMNTKNLTKLSIQIITEYYKDNLEPFFKYIDEEILWIGPAQGQWLQGKPSILATWEKEDHNLSFTMNNIRATSLTSSHKFCEIVLTYGIVTHYSNGLDIHLNQILHYTWCERKIKQEDGTIIKEPKLLMLHISNPLPYDHRDTIYPVHRKEVSYPEKEYSKKDGRIIVNGINRSIYSLLTDKIYWLESVDKGLHSIIHCEEENVSVLESISTLAKLYPKDFIQIHISYLINPEFVESIQRFQVKMRDGTMLPIPQKKYTAIKAALLAYWSEQK